MSDDRSHSLWRGRESQTLSLKKGEGEGRCPKDPDIPPTKGSCGLGSILALWAWVGFTWVTEKGSFLSDLGMPEMGKLRPLGGWGMGTTAGVSQ